MEEWSKILIVVGLLASQKMSALTKVRLISFLRNTRTQSYLKSS